MDTHIALAMVSMPEPPGHVANLTDGLGSSIRAGRLVARPTDEGLSRNVSGQKLFVMRTKFCRFLEMWKGTALKHRKSPIRVFVQNVLLPVINGIAPHSVCAPHRHR